MFIGAVKRMRENAWSVSQLTKYIKSIIDHDWQLQDVWVNGEISNFVHHSSGHMYFSIKDEKSVIRTIMFAGNNRSLGFSPKNGMRVLIKGYVSLYERDGQYQLYAQEMHVAGIGNLYVAFQQLKERLAKEGLFSEAYKKPIPFLPKGIAIITSPTGAAIRDILITLKRRNPRIPVYVVPTLVQGERAPKDIVESISLVEEQCKDLVDVIILARGGGSIEELWAFNEEIVAKKIFASTLPIIVGVGHETDVTIADFTADVRAATPTGAAELVAPRIYDIEKEIQSYSNRLTNSIALLLNRKHERLAYLSQSKVLKSPENLITQQQQTIDQYEKDLQQLVAKQLGNSANRYTLLCQRLNDLSPLQVLERGYSITYKLAEEKVMIHSIQQVEEQDRVHILLKDGVIDCQVRGIHNHGKE